MDGRRRERKFPPQPFLLHPEIETGNRVIFDEHRLHDGLRQGADADAHRTRSDQGILSELIKVLTPHPSGLRRWSVMRAIRKDREKADRKKEQESQ